MVTTYTFAVYQSLIFKHMYMYVDCGGNGEHKMNTQTVVTHAYGSRPRF